MQDVENTVLQLEAPDESAINNLLGYPITYRIAVGPQARAQGFHPANRARSGTRKRKQ